MNNHYKLFGNPTKTNIEISLDLSRWLIGFGWKKHDRNKYVQGLSIHVNLLWLAVILTIR